MVPKQGKVWRLILGWILANYLGVGAIGAFALLLPFLKALPGRLSTSLVIGIPIGIAQWIALRRLAQVSVFWMITISLGQFVGLVVLPSLGSMFWGSLDDESVLALTLGFATMGLIAGLAQWILLVPHFNRAWVWSLCSAAGIGLGSALVLGSGLVDLSGIISIILVILAYAVLTGWVLAWLQTSQRKREWLGTSH